MSDYYDLIITGGGTAGHVLPLLPIVEIARKHGWRILFIGSSQGGPEEKLSREWGIEFYGIQNGKLRRYLSWKNLSDLCRVMIGTAQALRVLRDKRPSIILSKGGFVSVPVVVAGRLLGLPVVAHESDSSLSLSSRIASVLGATLCTGFPASCYAHQGVQYTGIPLRSEILSDETKPMQTDNDPVGVLVFFGSLGGSSRLQTAVREAAAILGAGFRIKHMVAANVIYTAKDIPQNYIPTPLTFRDFDRYLRQANVVICRAGATTLAEIAVLRRRAVLIPLSRRLSRGDQLRNATFFEENIGGAIVLSEEDASGASLADAVRRALKQSNGQGSSEWAQTHKVAAQEIFRLLCQYKIRRAQ